MTKSDSVPLGCSLPEATDTDIYIKATNEPFPRVDRVLLALAGRNLGTTVHGDNGRRATDIHHVIRRPRWLVTPSPRQASEASPGCH